LRPVPTALEPIPITQSAGDVIRHMITIQQFQQDLLYTCQKFLSGLLLHLLVPFMIIIDAHVCPTPYQKLILNRSDMVDVQLLAHWEPHCNLRQL
jgi:hypothetical protein